MGILTDPSASQGKYVQLLINYYQKLCFLMYIGAVVWFCMLSHNSVSIPTNFSENALLPALVNSEFNEESSAKQYYNELLDEMAQYKDSIPYPWLIAKFRQIGIETYYHNFTLNYPLGKNQKFTGKNVYGILRGARASSTEAVILSVPYRPPSSVHAPTTASVALMLAFAKFANRAQYWAKDIIFLVTEHEQLGIQAWLEAYHGTRCGANGVLEHGDLRGRAGSLQTAINLELHDTNIVYIDVKIEGLNGNLPNLDLVNLVFYICSGEGVQQRFKNRPDYYVSNQYKKWKYSFGTMVSMIATQSTGIPNGNHGLFHRFGIEAITIEGFNDPKKPGRRADFSSLGRIMEMLFRSLNNLLERFHQSYFFYLLPSSDRFVSIGLYIPIIMLLGGILLIKPCAEWHDINIFSIKKGIRDIDIINNKSKVPIPPSNDQINLSNLGVIILSTHAIGIILMNSPSILTKVGLEYAYSADKFVYLSFASLSILMLLLPLIMPGIESITTMNVLNIVASLELGTVLIAIGMMNFSLALFCGVFYVPIVLFITPTHSRLKKVIMQFLWILLQPLVVITAVVLAYTILLFPNEMFLDILKRTVSASEQALMFSIVDSMVYGNWLYNVVTAIFLPIWLCFWIVLASSRPKDVSKESAQKQKKE